MFEESCEAEILNFCILLKDEESKTTETRTDFETESATIDRIDFFQGRHQWTATIRARVHGCAEHQQMNKQNGESFKKLNLGKCLPFLFE